MLFLSRVPTETGAPCLLWRPLNRAYILFIGTRGLSQKHGAATGAARFRGVGVAAFAVPIFGNFTLAGVSWSTKSWHMSRVFFFHFRRRLDEQNEQGNKRFLKKRQARDNGRRYFLRHRVTKKDKRRSERLPSNFRHLETPALNADFNSKRWNYGLTQSKPNTVLFFF